MSNDNDNGAVSSWIRDVAILIVAVTGLVSALGFHCDNSAKIEKNTQAIGEIKDTATAAAEKADIAKDKAVTIEKKVEKIEAKTDK